MSRQYAKDPHVNHSLHHSIKDGIAYSVMSGSGESFFSVFALHLKATTEQVGLLATLPTLLASLTQLFSAWLGRRGFSRKRIILFGATLQAVSIIPLGLLPVLFPTIAIPLLIIISIVYFSGANIAAPQWSSLVGDLVPEQRRGRFFALRTRLCSISGFLALVFSGIILDLFDNNGYTMVGYIVLFSIAASARFVSVYHLSQMVDTAGHVAVLESPFQIGLWKRLSGSSFVRFSLFFALMQFAVAIASPYFVVYMLRDLQFSYLEYTIVTAMSVLMQFLALNRWGRISDVFGNRLILVVTGIMIPLLPIMWIISTNYLYILLIQAFGGMAWAGFTLSAGNYLYDLIPSHKRATYMAFHNVVASIAVFCGALIGAYLAINLPKEILIFNHHFEWTSVFYGVFVLSTILRAIVSLLFLPRLKEMRNAKPMTVGGLIFRVTRFHPLSGLNFDVISPKKRKPYSPSNNKNLQ